MTSAPLDVFTAALDTADCSPRERSGKWVAKCPAHDDKSPSLSFVAGADGRVLLTCHAGCTYDAVVGALRLQPGDLFPAKVGSLAGSVSPPAASRGCETVYLIRDAEGAIVAEHVRVEAADGSKRFVWRRDGKPGLGGIRCADLPLYGAHELRHYADFPVVVTEGEKACDALRNRGILAVGTVTGANSCPSATSLELLRGRDVVLWPDNDTPGELHMGQVAAALGGVASQVRMFRWAGAPPKGDAADWSGETEDLRTALDAAPPWRHAEAAGGPAEAGNAAGWVETHPTPSDASAGQGEAVDDLPWRTFAEIHAAAKARPREWLLPRVLYFGSVALLIGGPKVAGKTTLFMSIVAAARRGEDLFGAPLACGPVRAVLLTEEADIDFDEKRIRLGFAEQDTQVPVLSRQELKRPLSWAEAIQRATARCVASGARILGVDTFYRWAQFAGDDAMKSSGVLAALDALSEAKRQGILVLLLHHAGKGASAAGREGGAAGLGSISQAGETEVNLELRGGKDVANPTHRTLHVESRATGVFDLVIELVPGSEDLGTPTTYREVGDPEGVRRRATEDRIVAYVAAHPGVTGKEIEQGVEARVADVQCALPRLCDKGGKLTRAKVQGQGKAFRYYPVGCAPSGAVPQLPPASLNPLPRSCARGGTPTFLLPPTPLGVEEEEGGSRPGDGERSAAPSSLPPEGDRSAMPWGTHV